MRFGDKQLTALYIAARTLANQKGLVRGLEDSMPALRKAIEKMELEIARRATQAALRKAGT